MMLGAEVSVMVKVLSMDNALDISYIPTLFHTGCNSSRIRRSLRLLVVDYDHEIVSLLNGMLWLFAALRER